LIGNADNRNQASTKELSACFCRQHKTLGGRSPAMAAGITSRPWDIAELFDRVMQNAE